MPVDKRLCKKKRLISPTYYGHRPPKTNHHTSAALLDNSFIFTSELKMLRNIFYLELVTVSILISQKRTTEIGNNTSETKQKKSEKYFSNCARPEKKDGSNWFYKGTKKCVLIALRQPIFCFFVLLKSKRICRYLKCLRS